MILVKNYIEGMPAEIFESAKIDGANDLTVFFKMVIPLSKPIIMTIALFVAITHWNSWFDAYLFTNAQSLKTIHGSGYLHPAPDGRTFQTGFHCEPPQRAHPPQPAPAHLLLLLLYKEHG